MAARRHQPRSHFQRFFVHVEPWRMQSVRPKSFPAPVRRCPTGRSTWNFVGKVAEVLARHADVEVVHMRCPEVFAGHSLEGGGHAHMVVHGRVAMADVQVGLAAVGLARRLNQRGQRLVGLWRQPSSMARKVPFSRTSLGRTLVDPRASMKPNDRTEGCPVGTTGPRVAGRPRPRWTQPTRHPGTCAARLHGLLAL